MGCFDFKHLKGVIMCWHFFQAQCNRGQGDQFKLVILTGNSRKLHPVIFYVCWSASDI